MTFMEDDGLDAWVIVAQHGFPVLGQALPHSTSSKYEVEEVVSVERQPVSDDLFTTPAGFQKRALADLVREPGR